MFRTALIKSSHVAEDEQRAYRLLDNPLMILLVNENVLMAMFSAPGIELGLVMIVITNCGKSSRITLASN